MRFTSRPPKATFAAIYDLQASAEEQQAANVDGTRQAVAFATAIDAGCFHHVSSIAAAGLYEGVFREDMFEEAGRAGHEIRHGLPPSDRRMVLAVFRPAPAGRCWARAWVADCTVVRTAPAPSYRRRERSVQLEWMLYQRRA